MNLKAAKTEEKKYFETNKTDNAGNRKNFKLYVITILKGNKDIHGRNKCIF